MSRGTVVAKRYAKALFQLALEQGLVAQTEDQLKLVVTVVESDAQIRAFLTAPNITLETKIQTLNNAFSGKASPIVLNTISLLLERGREGSLAAVLEAYLNVAGESLGRADADVTSAKALSDSEQQKLAEKFGTLLGKTIRVTNTVNKDLLGGVTVRIGDTLYDGSLRTKLDRLEKSLLTAVN
ncbi:F0F1 ATP synthase subunit delta [Cohnella sp.]|uniref:F0F1 ATP synthase subunit delta n=1 Tax=Cohnella sp. TaxID=1883426 RepID=UPI0035666217